jgi:RNA polymerase sigma-70 factor (ECF subfamily)
MFTSRVSPLYDYQIGQIFAHNQPIGLMLKCVLQPFIKTNNMIGLHGLLMAQSNTSNEEGKLVEKAAIGDKDAFGEIYQRYLDPIYRYIFFRVGVTEDAEDLTESVFIKVWEALPGYRSMGLPLSSWIFRIAHNIVVDFHRKKGNETISLEEKDEWVDPGQAEQGPLSQVIAKENISRLSKAILMLSEEQQQVIVLRFLEGMSHKEIGRIIGKHDGACRMIQLRAIDTLTRLLSDEPEGQ